MPILVFENGPDKGMKIPLLPDKVFTGGRDPNCDIPIRDELVAARHFKIKEHKGSFYIRDMDTENGLRINDAAVKQKELNAGDKIQAGATIFSFLEKALIDPLIGKSIAGYEILEHLGRGGMGTVYLARQLSLKRDVAIKLLSPRLVRNAEFRDRFIQEARAAGSFNHPNVLQVYDVIHEQNLCFYSMEYISGGSVEDLLNKGEVPLDRALAIIREATEGLVYAEQKQIMHHDLKPQNLMITELGTTKISDMGLASSLDDSASDGAGGLMGTPHFMSPERIQRKALDIRSDIYSMGCTFYMILTGKTPFRGEKVKEILIKQVREEAVPIREIRPDVPEPVARIIQRMMAKDPGERHASAQDLLTDLESVGLKKKGRLMPLVAGAIVILAVALYFLVFKQDAAEDPSGQPQLPVNQTGSEEDDQLKEEVADLKKQMKESEAARAFLTLPADLSDEARAQRLTELVTRYEGTPTAEKADKEAREILDRLKRESDERAALAQKFELLKKEAGPALEDLLARKQFGQALVFASKLGEGGDLPPNHPDLKAYREAEVDRISKACQAHCDSVVLEAEKQREQHAYPEALAALEGGMKSMETGEPEKGKSPLKPLRDTLQRERDKTLGAEKVYSLALFDGDRDQMLASPDPLVVRGQVVDYDFEKAEAALAPLQSRMKSPAYQALAEALHRGVAAGARLMARFVDSVDQAGLERTSIMAPDMERSEEGAITGLLEDKDGLKILVTQGKRTRVSNVPFSRFIGAYRFIHLLENRFPMTAADKLDLAEAALHFTVAGCAAHLDPLERTVASYNAIEGWTPESEKAAALTPLPFEGDDEIARLASEAGAEDPSLAEAAEALKIRVAMESAAVDAFYEGVGPFIDPASKDSYLQAQTRLDAFARSYSDTFFFWYIRDLMGGSTRTGGHLVEQGE